MKKFSIKRTILKYSIFIVFMLLIFTKLGLADQQITPKEISPGTQFGGMSQGYPTPNPIVQERRQEPQQRIQINISPNNSSKDKPPQTDETVPKKGHSKPKFIETK